MLMCFYLCKSVDIQNVNVKLCYCYLFKWWNDDSDVGSGDIACQICTDILGKPLMWRRSNPALTSMGERSFGLSLFHSVPLFKTHTYTLSFFLNTHMYSIISSKHTHTVYSIISLKHTHILYNFFKTHTYTLSLFKNTHIYSIISSLDLRWGGLLVTYLYCFKRVMGSLVFLQQC